VLFSANISVEIKFAFAWKSFVIWCLCRERNRDTRKWRLDRERRKEEERLLRERQREEERFQWEQRRENERMEKFLLKQSRRVNYLKTVTDDLALFVKNCDLTTWFCVHGFIFFFLGSPVLGMLSQFPPQTVRLKVPFSIKPWTGSKDNIMLQRFWW
jgi:hypothetical protein